MADKKLVRIDIEPVGRRVEVPPGTALLAAVQAAGVELISVCGGIGSCIECKLLPLKGELSPLSLVEQAQLSIDEISRGVRLACQARAFSDVLVDLPPSSLSTPQRLQLEGLSVDVRLDPVLCAYNFLCLSPSLDDLRSDQERLLDALKDAGLPELTISRRAMSALSPHIREQGWQGRAVLRRDEVVGILPPEKRLLGLAIDIGTTKLAAYLVDLESGQTLAQGGAMNPQIGFGEDVISRIAYANQGEGGKVLQERLVSTLNQLVQGLCAQAGECAEQVLEAVVVGNTAMHHLFAGLPVRQLGAAPYVPAANRSLEFPAGEVGLQLAPGAYIYMPPNIAGYVGSDHVAMLLASGLASACNTVLALDIGTNTEISLLHQGQHLSCSCASGPAFEGAHIKYGMRGSSGAIEAVRILPGQVLVHTIDNQPAVGICGSGILDAVAQMLKAGVIDRHGAMSGKHMNKRGQGSSAEFILATQSSSGSGQDITITRKDVNEIQLAKGAIRAGIDVLLERAGIEAAEIGTFIVAGAFGTYQDIDSAISIGMFPNLPRERFKQVGNAAGAGARQLLLSAGQRQFAEEIARRMEYIELTTYPRFRELYVRALGFA